jgi:Flp pilus assembly protein TadD
MRQGLEMARGGAFEEARQLFERALELNAADPEGWNNLGFVLIRQRDFQRGVEAFRRALRLKPDHVEAHRNLAVALERQGKAREAVHHYRAFLGLSGDSHPDRAEVRRRLAEPESRKSEE